LQPECIPPTVHKQVLDFTFFINLHNCYQWLLLPNTDDVIKVTALQKMYGGLKKEINGPDMAHRLTTLVLVYEMHRFSTLLLQRKSSLDAGTCRDRKHLKHKK
jgi:hypothetical protein